MQSKVMSKLADSVPVLRKYNVNLDFKAEQSPVLTALSGSLAIADDLNNKKDEVVSTSLMTKFKKQNLMWEKEWASDPLKMRDKRYTAKMLETKNAMLQAHLDEIDKSTLSSNVKKKFVDDYGITAKDDFLKLSKTIVEQNNAVELEKLTMVLNDNILMTKNSTSYKDLDKNIKMLKKSLDNTSAYKTEEERTQILIKAITDSTLELDTRDAMLMIAKEPDMKKTLGVIDKFVETRLSKEYKDDFIQHIVKEYGVNKDIAERVYNAQSEELETKLLQKKNTILEYLDREQQKRNTEYLQLQKLNMKEKLDLEKTNLELQIKDVEKRAEMEAKLLKDLRSGANSSEAVSKAIDNSYSLIAMPDKDVKKYYNKKDFSDVYKSGKTVSIITDEMYKMYSQSIKDIMKNNSTEEGLRMVSNLLYGVDDLSQGDIDVLSSNLVNRGLMTPLEQYFMSSDTNLSDTPSLKTDFLKKSSLPPLVIVSGTSQRRIDFAQMSLFPTERKNGIWNNYLINDFLQRKT